MTKEPRVCLNMIVKNESNIIIRLLESVYKYIDSYCICDTGSSDNTMEIIETFFSKHKIEGTLFQEPFRDFGYNRTKALEKCCKMKKVDYILFLDADMVFWVDPSIPPSSFKKHLAGGQAFHLFQGTAHFQYFNVRIVKKQKGLSYWGVTHEHLVLPKDTEIGTIDRNQVFINDVGDGGSKTNKFSRDIDLLNKGLQDEPNHPRYLFYLANSYRDNEQYAEAVETYFKRINAKGWIEEVWYSYYSIGNCYLCLEKPREAFVYYLEAYEIMPERIENLYRMVHFYRINEQYHLAMAFYEMAKTSVSKNDRKDFLFMEKDIYDFKLDYEYSIIAFYCKEKPSVLSKLAMKLLGNDELPFSIVQSILTNYRFYTAQITKKHDNCMDDLINTLNKCIVEKEGFQPSTPSLLKVDAANYFLNIRYVNYKIDEKGNYNNVSKIITKNAVYQITKREESWESILHTDDLKYDKVHDGYYCGLEDIRLCAMSKDPVSLGYICNRGLANQHIQVEKGSLKENFQETCESTIIDSPKNKMVEKNWVYVNINDPKTVVYTWYPLSLGNIVENTFKQTVEHKTPLFFSNVRGSCHGTFFQEEKEIWFLCHYVIFDYRRFYYHMIVVLNSDDYTLKKYTRFFTFEKKPIEYCLGSVYEKEKDCFLFSYSINDACAKFTNIPKKSLDIMMIDHIR